MRTAMASMYRRPSRRPPSCKNPAVAETAEEPAATTSDVNPPKAAPVRVGAWPMWVLGLVVLIDQVDQNLVRGVVPQLKSDFGIDDFGIGVLISAFVLVNGIVTVPAGYLADRWHRTRTIGHTVVAWSGITMLTGASQNFGQLIAGRALLGFGQAITEPSANSLISDYYPTEQRGSAFSVQQIMGIIGFGVGIALGGAIGSQYGWHWAFIVVGPPGFVIAAIAYRPREPRRGHGDRPHLGITEDEPVEEHTRLFEHGVRRFFVDMMTGLRDDLRVIISIPTLKFALVGVGAFMFTITGIGGWLPEFHRRSDHRRRPRGRLPSPHRVPPRVATRVPGRVRAVPSARPPRRRRRQDLRGCRAGDAAGSGAREPVALRIRGPRHRARVTRRWDRGSGGWPRRARRRARRRPGREPRRGRRGRTAPGPAPASRPRPRCPVPLPHPTRTRPASPSPDRGRD